MTADARDALAVDAVVLDVDGVLVDVADSYRRAVVESVERVHGTGETDPEDPVVAGRVERADLQPFKDAGGFNNDWDLTYAVALYVLARREGLDRDLDSFADVVAATGGGLEGAETVVADALDPDCRERALAEWDRERLHATFQRLYLGPDLYRELEGGDPDALGVDPVGRQQLAPRAHHRVDPQQDEGAQRAQNAGLHGKASSGRSQQGYGPGRPGPTAV